MKKVFAIAILLCASACAAEDVAVTIKAVRMENGFYSTEEGGHSYTWHAMQAEIDGVTYTVADNPHFRREHWLHKGTYTGRWKNSKHTKLEVDFKDGNDTDHYEFHVLGEE